MRVAYDNVWATVKDIPDAFREHLYEEYLAYETVTYFRGIREVRRGSLYNARRQAFPSGLVGLVAKEAKAQGVPIEVADRRQPPIPPCPLGDLEWVTDDERYAFHRDAIRTVHERTRGVLQCATGAGKTNIAVNTARAIPCRWLFIVPNKDLLHNAANRFEQLTGWAAGRVGDGYFQIPPITDPGPLFVAATVQTLISGIKRKDKDVLHLVQDWAQGVFVDECHGAAAESYTVVLRNALDAYYRVGLSATPFDRGDERGILAVGYLGPTIFKKTARDLIELGVIAEPKIRMVHHEIDHEVFDSWPKAKKHHITESPDRNGLVADMAVRAAKPCLVFVDQLKHGSRMLKTLRGRGLNCEYVDGKSSGDQRDRVAKGLDRGDLEVVVATVFETFESRAIQAYG